MTEQVLRTGEAARNRRLKHRNPELQVGERNESETLEDKSNPETKSWLFIALKSLSKSLTVLQLFHYYSGILYLTLGILFTIFPSHIFHILLIKTTSQAISYGRLTGVNLVGVGVFCVISALSSPRLVPVNRIIIGTVFERLIFVNISCILIIFKHNGPLGLTSSVIAMDTVLAVITYILWAKETNTKNLTSIFWTFRKTLQLLPPQNITLVSRSSLLVKLIGYLQAFLGTLFLIRPDIVQNAFHLDPFDEHSKGILSLALMGFAVIGWLHLFAGSADALLFNVTAVFYRFFISIPLVYFLATSNQIAPDLAMCFVYFDSIAAFSVIIFLYAEK